MTIKLIATDMDGTFLDKKSQYDKKRLQNVLAKAKEQGIRFVVASGRSLHSLKDVFPDFTEDIIFLGENGMVVEYRGQTLYEEVIPKPLYLEMVQKIKNSHFEDKDLIHLSGKQKVYVLSDINKDYYAFLKHYYPIIEMVDSFEEVEDRVYKIGANFAADEVYEASQWITQQVDGLVSLTSGYESLDVIMEHVDKGNALRHLCEKLHIAPEEVLAFGDNYNDTGMMEFSGTAVAPENAVAEIKEIANQIIADHDTASVIAYMEEIVCQSN